MDFVNLHLDSDIFGLYVKFYQITFWKHLTIGHILVITDMSRSVQDSNIACCNSYCVI